MDMDAGKLDSRDSLGGLGRLVGACPADPQSACQISSRTRVRYVDRANQRMFGIRLVASRVRLPPVLAVTESALGWCNILILINC